MHANTVFNNYYLPLCIDAVFLEGPSDVKVVAGSWANFTCVLRIPCEDEEVVNWHRAGYKDVAIRQPGLGDVQKEETPLEDGTCAYVLRIIATEDINQTAWQCAAVNFASEEVYYSKAALLTGKYIHLD